MTWPTNTVYDWSCNCTMEWSFYYHKCLQRNETFFVQIYRNTLFNNLLLISGHDNFLSTPLQITQGQVLNLSTCCPPFHNQTIFLIIFCTTDISSYIMFFFLLEHFHLIFIIVCLEKIFNEKF